MADRIDIPAKGDKAKATWGAKVADMLNRHESALEEFGPGRPANLRERRAAPFPYECRVVVSSLGAGASSPALAVFAPQGVLTIDASAVGIDTSTAMQGMEAGWYTFDGVDVPEAGESSEVWLRVEFPEESGADSKSESESESPSEPTAELVADDDSGGGEDDEGNVQKVLIARVTAHSGGGYKVEQFIRSSLHLATPSAPAASSITGTKTEDVITGISFAFDANTNRLVATLTKKKLTVIDTAAISGDPPTAALPLWKQNVDSASAYSESTNKFTKVVMPSVRTEETEPSGTTDVFEAVSHDEEYGSD